MEFKESLKVMRTELKMSQTELASALHVSKRSVSRWELGKAFPHLGTAEQLLALAQKRDVSAHCCKNLREALSGERTKVIRVPRSRLYPVDRESICQLVDGSHTGIYVCDLETDEVLYANRKAEAYAGRPFSTGKKCYEFLYGNTTCCAQCPKAQMVEHESSNEYITSPRDGRTYHFRGRRLLWNGRPAHAQYFFEESPLDAQDSRTVAFIDRLDVGLCVCWVYDSGAIELTYMSDGYYSLVHSTREKRARFAGFAAPEAVCKADRARVRAAVLKASGAQSACRLRCSVLLDDGTEKELYLRACFVRREKNKSLFYGTVMDIDRAMQGQESE